MTDGPQRPTIRFPAEEEQILEFWERERIFEKSLELRRDSSEYVFYDGPPFATGLPHYGNLLAGTIKDVVPRYQTMRGHYVERVFGWDCHGLPIENEMEQLLGINSKQEIEEYGIDRFNEACRGIVLKYTVEWQRIVRRMGRWVDFEHGYRTMDRDYMESIWWVFKQLWDKDLIYEGNKIMWYCPRCATPLSNFEVNQGYVEVEDPAITVRFKVHGRENTWFLAWTTTPWTLPANFALAVGPDIDYVEVRDGDDTFILAEARVHQYWRDDTPDIVRRCKGDELTGLTYKPCLPYYETLAEDGAFIVITADFVTTEDGTGVVHIAPGFGEEDAAAGQLHGLPAHCPIDDNGCYTDDVPEYAGRFVKDCDLDIIRRIKKDGNLVHRGTCVHNYPHCWRCDTPLLNRAVATWFVSVEKIKDSMLAANDQIYWMPAHMKQGRFGKWLENARDWAISRNRYWGCPMPIWRNSDTGETVCIGSIQELEERCGRDVDDIHKHFVDHIELPGAEGGSLTRVPQVLDCWFESGSMPYAQRHYPFENKEWLDTHFPADFVAEGLDQTRGWFYTLIVLGAALFDKPAFRNVIVNGMILAEDGEKMSKRKKNYPDPENIMNTYGADALRLCLLTSPVVRGDDMRFSERAVSEAMRSVLLPLSNAFQFFSTYAIEVDGWTADSGDTAGADEPAHIMDRWLRSRVNHMAADIRDAMDRYDLQTATTRLTGFIDELTNWYIRLNRRRVWKSENDDDKQQAYATLYHALVSFCKCSAPFIPFITERVYRALRSDSMPESVHMCDFPDVGERDLDLERKMARARNAVSLGRHLRTQAKQRIRQPLRNVFLLSLDAEVRSDLGELKGIIANELNVREVTIRQDEEELVTLSAKANFKRLGPRFGKNMKAAAESIQGIGSGDIRVLLEGGTISINLNGESSEEITLDDIEIRREQKDDMAVANENAITVALDLALDEELIMDGWSRELVHVIQNYRKDIALDVTDRIRIFYQADASLQKAVVRFGDYIKGETLALDIVAQAPLEEQEKGRVVDVIPGHGCKLYIEKAESGQ